MKDLDVADKLILKFTLKKWNMYGVICFRISSGDELCSTAVNLWIPLEILGVEKCLLKENSAPLS